MPDVTVNTTATDAAALDATNAALATKVDGLGGVTAVKYAATLPAWTSADEGTLIFVPSA